jgi:hypothetical protein
MAEYKAVSNTRHQGKTWRSPTDLAAFSTERTLPLVAAEFPKACLDFPIAWVESDGFYEPIVLLGLMDAENVFIDTSDRWVGSYVPAYLRAQPFRLIRTDDQQLTLGVREDIGLVSDNGSGRAFFAADGELSEELQAVVDMLKMVEENRAATIRASQALKQTGALEPWSLGPVVNGKKRRINGLYRVSQKALDAADAQSLEYLRDTGALAMAYCQQISQQLIRRLQMLHERRAAELVNQSAHPADRDNFGLGEDEAISFGGI